ncbi:hypothetical protein F5B19DRAFT_483647 [Rostrohypoxylon terebratum]|nr:hypothetical protein F5B19DRAFT_483647 [Rostrohypoxylon terebratum]
MADESMTTCEGMPPDSSIAIANWSDTNHGVRQRTYDQGRWDGGTESDIIFKAETATPLAAMQWFSRKSDPTYDYNSIRLYHLDDMSTKANTNRWFGGELDRNTAMVAGDSKTASVHWSDFLRIICQGPDGLLHEHCHDYMDPWYAGKTLPCPADTKPYSGTAIAAVSRNPSAPETFMAKCFGSWSVGDRLFKAQKGSGMAAVIRPSENAIQVFCANEYGILTKHKGEPGNWKTTPGKDSQELLENTAIAGRVYKSRADGKEKVTLVFVLKVNGESRAARVQHGARKKSA